MNNKRSGLLSSMAIIQLVGVIIIANLMSTSIHLEIAIYNLQIRTIMYHQLFIGSTGNSMYEDVHFMITNNSGKCIFWEDYYGEGEQLCLE